MNHPFLAHLTAQVTEMKHAGLYKEERVIVSPQRAVIQLAGKSGDYINLCANNYLGLADDAQLIEVGKQALEEHGYGMASVRFICGTQMIHQQLEAKLSAFLGMEDTILYSSCFDANGGLFETLLGAEDAVISDSLNHASIIDGIRLGKAKRFRYANNDMVDLERQLQAAQEARYKLIVTDGVFSMDGIIADLPNICRLADQYNALVMVDDSHSVGFMGPCGRGTHELLNVMDRIDILTGTLGKALGGASGGYVSGRKPIIELLRQRSRPYLFSNTLAPMITRVSLSVLDRITQQSELRTRLHQNSAYFRENMTQLGFKLIPGCHPIIPILLEEAKLSAKMAHCLLEEGVYVISFSYPVVPEGKARIRTQISASHTKELLDRAISAFEKVGRNLRII